MGYQKTSFKSFLKPVSSVVLIGVITGVLFSASQTYALDANENSPVNKSQIYQQTAKVSDFISKVFTFFANQSNIANQNTEQEKNVPKSTICNESSENIFGDINESQYRQEIVYLYNK
jgi:hypothetical protein